jgi:hypothetical protein
LIQRAKSSAVIALKSEAEAFFAAHPHIDAIDMIYTDMGGVPRGKRLRQHEVLAVYETGRMFPGSITVVDITGQDTVETGLVWEDGDADRSMKPIPGTLVPTPWAGDGSAQFLVDFYELDGTPHDLDPRHVLGLLALEGFWVTCAGVVLGVLLAQAAMALGAPWLQNAMGIRLQSAMPLSTQWAVAAAVLLAGMLASLGPAWRAYRLSLADGLSPRV